MNPKPPPLPTGSALRTSDASRFGLTRARLRVASVEHPFTGVSTIGLDMTSIIDTARAFEPLLRPGEAFSHLTAAQLLGVPLPRSVDSPSVDSSSVDSPSVDSPSLDSPAVDSTPTNSPSLDSPSQIHVTAPAGMSRSRTRWVVGHESATAFPVYGAHGLPVVAPPLLWRQLAPLLSAEDLVAAGDFLVTRRRTPQGFEPALASITDLQACADSAHGRRGAPTMAWAVQRIRVGADSRPETLLRLLLVAAGLPEPLINDPTPLENGRLIRHPDLKYPEWRIVLEYEGDRHRTDKKRWRRDITRREQFEDAGWRVIRVTSDDVFVHPEAFIARVLRIIASR